MARSYYKLISIHCVTSKSNDLRIDGIGLALVSVEPNNREFLPALSALSSIMVSSTYSLDLTGVDLNDADARGDELLPQGLGE